MLLNIKGAIMQTRKNLKYSLLLLLILFLVACEPVVTIVAPQNNEQFEVGEEITFSGSALDLIAGELDGEFLVWTSSIDGEIGAGRTFIKDDLSEGIHKIILTAINSQNERVTATITIIVGKGQIVTHASQLLSILHSQDFGYLNPYSGGNLPITDDIQVAGTVTISSLQIEVPEDCKGEYNYCRQSVGFEDNYGADGISLSPLSSEYFYPPSSLTLTNVRLRFRPLIINTGPWEYNFIPVIQLMPPSDHECDDTQTKCDVDEVCYDNYFSYCLYCLALSQEECACRDARGGIFADGTPCIVVGGCIVSEGECQDGLCVVEWY